MTEPSNKAEFQDQLQQSWSELQRTLDGFTEEQMTQRTDQVGWTVKDHLSHLVSWERGIIALLKKEQRWQAMGLDPDVVRRRTEDELNQVMRDRDSAVTLAEVRGRLEQAQEELTALVGSMDPEDLLRTYSHYQPEESGKGSTAPVLGWVVGNSSAHYQEHLPWIRDLAGGAG